METTTARTNLVNLVLKALALAMGVAVIVLQVLGTVTPSALVPLLGIGLFAMALAAFRTE